MFLEGNLLFHDANHHRRLRHAANGMWLNGRADVMIAEARQQIASHLDSLTVGGRYDMGTTVGEAVTKIVLAAALGVAATDQVVNAVINAAPVLNALVTPDADIAAADDACARLLDALSPRLADASEGRGLLGAVGHSLDVKEAATLASGVATAGVEATRAFAVQCAFAAVADVTAREVIDHASPVSTALYGATGELKCGAAQVADGDLIVANLTHLSFGYGPHFCLGTRLALEAGDVVIETLRRRGVCFEPDETLQWQSGPLTRTIESAATLRVVDG